MNDRIHQLSTFGLQVVKPNTNPIVLKQVWIDTKPKTHWEKLHSELIYKAKSNKAVRNKIIKYTLFLFAFLSSSILTYFLIYLSFTYLPASVINQSSNSLAFLFAMLFIASFVLQISHILFIETNPNYIKLKRHK